MHPGEGSLPFPRLRVYGIAATRPDFPAARCAPPGLDPAALLANFPHTREWQVVDERARFYLTPTGLLMEAHYRDLAELIT